MAKGDAPKAEAPKPSKVVIRKVDGGFIIEAGRVYLNPPT